MDKRDLFSSGPQGGAVRGARRGLARALLPSRVREHSLALMVPVDDRGPLWGLLPLGRRRHFDRNVAARHLPALEDVVGDLRRHQVAAPTDDSGAGVLRPQDVHPDQ
eukprot:2221671-Pyramimonas_sp.AAC.1